MLNEKVFAALVLMFLCETDVIIGIWAGKLGEGEGGCGPHLGRKWTLFGTIYSWTKVPTIKVKVPPPMPTTTLPYWKWSSVLMDAIWKTEFLCPFHIKEYGYINKVLPESSFIKSFPDHAKQNACFIILEWPLFRKAFIILSFLYYNQA